MKKHTPVVRLTLDTTHDELRKITPRQIERLLVQVPREDRAPIYFRWVNAFLSDLGVNPNR